MFKNIISYYNFHKFTVSFLKKNICMKWWAAIKFTLFVISFKFTLIRYLRKHPYKDDGQHIQSFLCNENWEDYLERMSRTREWGDHIILQALVDAYNLKVTIFNVFENDVRHNVLQPGADTKRKLMQVFLGHIGEFHYLSLRPCHWADLWPYSKYFYRLMLSCYKL